MASCGIRTSGKYLFYFPNFRTVKFELHSKGGNNRYRQWQGGQAKLGISKII